MRALLHVASVVLLLPSLIFASGFVILGRAIAAASIWGFFDRLLSDALWLATWGIFAAIALLVAILAGGFFATARWLAALCVSVLSLASATALIVLGSGPFAAGQWLFFLPGLASLAMSSWLVFEEWPKAADARHAS